MLLSLRTAPGPLTRCPCLPHSLPPACLPRPSLPCRWKAQLTVKEMCRDQWAWASNNPAGYLTGASEEELKLAKEKGLL